MEKEHEAIIKKINTLIECFNRYKDEISLYIIASTKENTKTPIDYPYHSITTSYLSRNTLEELISFFREFDIYTEVYIDFEYFLKEYYQGNLLHKPTIIFETSSKGIGRGRDALIPAFCDILGLKHLGSNPSTSVMCCSKYQWTCILEQHKISVPETFFFNYDKWIDLPPINKKLILKLNYECASVGLSQDSCLINDGENITIKAKSLWKNYLQPVLAQEFISGYEVEVPIIVNNQFHLVLPPVGLSLGDKKFYEDEFFDYETIYYDDYGLYDFSEIDKRVADNLVSCVHKIIEILDLSGYMRVDFRIDRNGNCFVIDINNDPCINSAGSFLKSLEILGFEKKHIAPILIGNALI